MRNTKKILSWIFYIAALAVVFLYFLFPSDAVKQYLQYQLESTSNNVISAEIDHLSPGFPPALVLKDVVLTYQQMDALQLDRAAVSPAYGKIFNNSRAVNFRADLGGGSALGWLELEDAGGVPQITLEMELENVEMESFHIIRNISGKTVSGSLEGELVFSGGMPGQTGSGSAQLRARQCTVSLEPAVFGLTEFTFRYFQADLEIENQRLNIAGLRLDGSQFSGEGSGRILLRQPVENSQIQLSLSIKPHPALLKTVGGMLPKKYLNEKGIPVRISGTVKDPSWSVR